MKGKGKSIKSQSTGGRVQAADHNYHRYLHRDWSRDEQVMQDIRNNRNVKMYEMIMIMRNELCMLKRYI